MRNVMMRDSGGRVAFGLPASVLHQTILILWYPHSHKHQSRVLIALCADRFVGASAQPLSIPRQALGTCVASSTFLKLLIILVKIHVLQPQR